MSDENDVRQTTRQVTEKILGQIGQNPFLTCGSRRPQKGTDVDDREIIQELAPLAGKILHEFRKDRNVTRVLHPVMLRELAGTAAAAATVFVEDPLSAFPRARFCPGCGSEIEGASSWRCAHGTGCEWSGKLGVLLRKTPDSEEPESASVVAAVAAVAAREGWPEKTCPIQKKHEEHASVSSGTVYFCRGVPAPKDPFAGWEKIPPRRVSDPEPLAGTARELVAEWTAWSADALEGGWPLEDLTAPGPWEADAMTVDGVIVPLPVQTNESRDGRVHTVQVAADQLPQALGGADRVKWPVTVRLYTTS